MNNSSSVYNNLDKLITSKLLNNALLFNHIYWVKQKIRLLPQKEHILSSIQFSDIKERKEDFIKELIGTVVAWVYETKKRKDIFNHYLSENEDYGRAATFLFNKARDKFRNSRPQGQFGELLLFNFLQKFFCAVPLLRKQPITTSPKMERFGADAIHIAKQEDKILFFLGEAKCYVSKYTFSNALKEAVESIIEHFNHLFDELDLYIYDGFLDKDLEIVANDLKSGKLKNCKFELVCIIIYNENQNIMSETENEIKSNIINTIVDHCNKFDNSYFNKFDGVIISRIHYILFPIWKLDEILEEFKYKL